VTAPIQYRLDGDVAVITLDDGKANALTPSSLVALGAALDRVEAEAQAVVITGRPGRFSAGFDLKIMLSGVDPARALLHQGAGVFMRLYGFPRPVVMACTGHALAGGCLTLLCGDVRVGARGAFKLGMNEVAIGMPLPILALELVRDRVRREYLDEATLFARIFSPDEALAAGMLTQVVAPEAVEETAMAAARDLARLKTSAYAQSKDRLRRATIAHIMETLDADMASFEMPAPGA
jgi:enoyl-CoA hydratase